MTILDKLVAVDVVVTCQKAGLQQYLANIYRTDDSGAQQASIGYGSPGMLAIEAATKEAIRLGWLKAEEIC